MSLKSLSSNSEASLMKERHSEYPESHHAQQSLSGSTFKGSIVHFLIELHMCWKV